MTTIVDNHMPKIIALCQKYKVSRLEIFGSAVTEEFDPETSDFDFLVEYPPGYDYGPWGSRQNDFQKDLAQILGRKVDLVIFKNVRNPFVSKSIERARLPLY